MVQTKHLGTRLTRHVAVIVSLAVVFGLSGAGAAFSAPAQGTAVNVNWRNEGYQPQKGWTTGEIGPYAEGTYVPFRFIVTNPSTSKSAIVGGFSLQVTAEAHGVQVFDGTSSWTGPVVPSSQDGPVDGMLRTTFPAGLQLAPGESVTFEYKAHLAVSTPAYPAAGMLNGNGVNGFSELDAAGAGAFGKRVPVKVAGRAGTLGTPTVGITKTSDAPPEGVRAGTPVTYKYVVTNMGDIPLLDVAVIDDKLGVIGSVDGPLAPGASVTFSGSATLSETTTNLGTVTAIDEYGRDVSDTAELTVPLVTSASVFGHVFDDGNNPDGAQDADEPGLEGWTIQLLDSGGSVLRTTTTNSEGEYSFGDLTPGQTYTVREVPQSGWVPTILTSWTFTPLSGQDAGSFDFGNFSAQT
jgi:hypothetical protein